MSKNYQEITKGILSGMKALQHQVPEMSKAFQQLAAVTAGQEGALDEKTKELIALAIGVSKHCDGCVGFHTKKLAHLGASEAEVAEALSVAIYMGGGPSLMTAAEAMQGFKDWLAPKDS
ncbi:MAG: carboxymuconolactone decarboxylase family protein [Pseudomonadales bacterium]|nr:carboxymuconolactone decarboxylase family protein [Pseudomonadales bacterium]